MAELMTQTELVGNAMLSPLQVDTDGVIAGFVIDNPQGPNLKVSLRTLRLDGVSEVQNNTLRKAVYDAYALGVRAVPAFTPLAECVAESATLIVHSDANWDGMHFKFVSVPKQLATQPEQHFYANMQGNPLLPDHVSTFSFNGMEQQVVVEQQGKYYLGKDGRWYTTNPLELVTHELVHGCGKLQGWSEKGELSYLQDIKSAHVPLDEVHAINFVNQTLLEPRGLPGRNPQSYYAAKPEGASATEALPLDLAGLEKLRHGPILLELEGYSHPELKAMESRMDDGVEGHPSSLAGYLARALEQAGLCDVSQAEVIARRMAEHAFASVHVAFDPSHGSAEMVP